MGSSILDKEAFMLTVNGHKPKNITEFIVAFMVIFVAFFWVTLLLFAIPIIILMPLWLPNILVILFIK